MIGVFRWIFPGINERNIVFALIEKKNMLENVNKIKSGLILISRSKHF